MAFPLKWDQEFFVPAESEPVPPGDVVVGRIDAIMTNIGYFETARGRSCVDYTYTPFRLSLLIDPFERYRRRRMIWSADLAPFMDRGSIRVVDVPNGLEVHAHFDLGRSLALWAVVGIAAAIALGYYGAPIGLIGVLVILWCSLQLIFILVAARFLPRVIRRAMRGDLSTAPVQDLLDLL